MFSAALRRAGLHFPSGGGLTGPWPHGGVGEARSKSPAQQPAHHRRAGVTAVTDICLAARVGTEVWTPLPLVRQEPSLREVRRQKGELAWPKTESPRG